MSLRRKTYLSIWAGVLVAAAILVVAVVKAVLVGSGEWTGSIAMPRCQRSSACWRLLRCRPAP